MSRGFWPEHSLAFISGVHERHVKVTIVVLFPDNFLPSFIWLDSFYFNTPFTKPLPNILLSLQDLSSKPGMFSHKESSNLPLSVNQLFMNLELLSLPLFFLFLLFPSFKLSLKIVGKLTIKSVWRMVIYGNILPLNLFVNNWLIWQLQRRCEIHLPWMEI